MPRKPILDLPTGIRCSGTTGGFSAPADAVFNTGSGFVMCRVLFKALSTANQRLFCFNAGSNDRVEVYIPSGALRCFIVAVAASSTKHDTDTGQSFSGINTWQHAAFQWNATGCKLWINGVNVYTGVVDSTINASASNQLRVGNYLFAGLQINGVISDVVWGNTTTYLTDAQVQNHMNYGTLPSSYTSYWNLQDARGLAAATYATATLTSGTGPAGVLISGNWASEGFSVPRIKARDIAGSITNTTNLGYAATAANAAYALTSGCFSTRVRLNRYQTAIGGQLRLFYLSGGGVLMSCHQSWAEVLTWYVASTSPSLSVSCTTTTSGSAQFFDGEYHTVTGHWSSAGLKLYIDGVMVAISTSNAQPGFSANPLIVIGNYGASSYGMLGNSTEIQIGSAVPTAAEVKAVHYLGADLPSCVSRWEVGKLSGSTVIDSKGVANLTLTTATKSINSPEKGRLSLRSFPFAQRFRKVDGTYISIPYNNIGTSISISIWFRPNWTAGETQALVSIMSTVLFPTDSQIRFYPDVYGGAEVQAFNFEKGKLYNLVLTQTGNSLIFYVNGNEVATITTVSGINTADFSNYIGKYSSNYTDSQIGQTQIWSRVLTAAEVSDLYFKNVTPTTGIENWYKLDEGGGTVATDSSGNGRDGTIAGGTWVPGFFLPRPIIKNYPYSLALNGASQYGVTAGNIAMSAATKLTVITWIKINALTGTTQVLLSNYDASAYFELHYDNSAASSAKKFLGLIGLAGNLNYSVTRELPLGTWFKVAMVYDGALAAASRVKMYVNGLLDSTNVVAGAVSGGLTDQPFTIGQRQSASAFFSNAKLSECVVIPGVAATAEQVFNNYFYDTAIGTATVDYEFTNGSGATVTDSSGNGDDLVFVNSPTWSATDVPNKSRTQI